MTNDRIGGNPDPNPTQVRKVRRHQSPEPYRCPIKTAIRMGWRW